LDADFRFIDLFAGIGGLRLGFERAGGRCVFTSEWNKYSQETYRANFACDHPLAGDITQIEASDIPAHDMLLAGFPCQPFSLAGVSKKNALNQPHGFRCETQGTLFFDVVRILEHHRPKAFLLENVRNLANHDRGNTIRVIKSNLEERLGYKISMAIIDARYFVPQHRERIFIAGFRDQEPPDLAVLKREIEATRNVPTLDDILFKEDGSEAEHAPYIDKRTGRVSDKYTLSDHLWTYLQNYAQKHREKGNGFGFGLCGRADVARTLSARYYKDGSEILIRQEGRNPRRLTPRECARLMGYSDTFQIPVSDAQSYRQFGNSVVVPVVERVAKYVIQDSGRLIR